MNNILNSCILNHYISEPMNIHWNTWWNVFLEQMGTSFVFKFPATKVTILRWLFSETYPKFIHLPKFWFVPSTLSDTSLRKKEKKKKRVRPSEHPNSNTCLQNYGRHLKVFQSSSLGLPSYQATACFTAPTLFLCLVQHELNVCISTHRERERD